MKIKNEFKRPKYIEETIVSRSTGKVVGTLRVFPSTIKWRPAGSPWFYTVRLEKFAVFCVENGIKERW